MIASSKDEHSRHLSNQLAYRRLERKPVFLLQPPFLEEGWDARHRARGEIEEIVQIQRAGKRFDLPS
jgi:hypothetical protein